LARALSFAIKVEMYHRLLHGQQVREIASAYEVSHPTATKYITEAVDFIKQQPEIIASTALQVFLAQQLRLQAFQYEGEPDVRDQLEPVLSPFLEEAQSLAGESRESADRPLTTRVSYSTELKFRAIVTQLNESGRPDLTVSKLLREIVELYVEQGTVPTPSVAIDERSRLDSALGDIKKLLIDYGFDG
jgi:hypothetical protein